MNERILLIEDDVNQQILYEQELVQEKYQVVLASSAQEALDYLKKQTFDLIILDICMPGKDGIEALSEIMELNNKIPVIINTAYGTYKENFLTWSAEAYVVKSSDLTELKTTIRNVIDRNKAGVD